MPVEGQVACLRKAAAFFYRRSPFSDKPATRNNLADDSKAATCDAASAARASGATDRFGVSTGTAGFTTARFGCSTGRVGFSDGRLCFDMARRCAHARQAWRSGKLLTPHEPQRHSGLRPTVRRGAGALNNECWIS